MTDRQFRFGVVATPQDGGAQWRSTAQRVAELGYSTLLMPDGLQLLSPIPSLAMAAAVTDLRVGTFVMAGPLRPPRSAAWEAHSLSVLTDGRFELGIGTGVPAAKEWAQQLGVPYGSGAERLTQVGQTIDHLRELDGDRHTPVLMAAGGPTPARSPPPRPTSSPWPPGCSPHVTTSHGWPTRCASTPGTGPGRSSSR